MITGKLPPKTENSALADRIAAALDFLARSDLAAVECGSQVVVEGEIIANFMAFDTVDEDDVQFETHDRFADIQLVISGSEVFGVADRADLAPLADYNPEKDITFYADPADYSRVILKAGEYIILFPEDAHKPKICLGAPAAVKKVVVKVLV